MMMRAQANTFMPTRAHPGTAEWDPLMKPGRGRCGSDMSRSTAVPSPAMTSVDGYVDAYSSPWDSPIRGAMRWPLYPGNGGALSAQHGALLPDSDQFVLPDADSNLADGEGANVPKPFTFQLNGLEDLASSVAALLDSGGKAPPLPPLPSSELFGAPMPPPGLCGLDPRGFADAEDECNASPGPPPGLGGPHGQQRQQRGGTEGSKHQTLTVSDLHAKFNNAGNAAKVRDEPVSETSLPFPLDLPDQCTTIMLRNIPNKYTQDMLTARLELSGYKGEVDFLYLPVDFKNKCNVGYAFINFRTSSACTTFAHEFHGARSWEKLPGFRSRKICEVSAARFQGRDENVARLQGSPVMVQLTAKPEWLPQIFDEAGEPLKFPCPESSGYGNTNTKGGTANGDGASGGRLTRGRLGRR